jgi:FkbM family methyltransferase
LALLRSVWWQARKRLLKTATDVRLPFGPIIRCYPDSQDASRVLYFNGIPDPNEMGFLRHYLRPGDNAIDAGANIGIYTLYLASLVGPTGTVLAFEPDKTCAARLRENVEINRLQNVTVRQAAISDFKGTAEFNEAADAAGSFAELRPSKRTQTVQVVMLKDEIGATKYTFGKMDVEGAEPKALLGAPLETHNPPVWQIELTRRTLKRSGTALEDVVSMLESHGYRLWTYNPKKRELIEWIERPRKPGHVGDVLAIADYYVSEVRQRIEQTGRR